MGIWIMEEIYKNTLLLIHSLTQLSGICYEYDKLATEETGENLIKFVDKCENKFLKVKREIVKMVEEVEKREKDKEVEIIGVKTENGFLIKE